MTTSESGRIWCNTAFAGEALAELRAGTAGHELVLSAGAAASVLASSPVDEHFAAAQIAFGQPDPAEILGGGAPQLRWVHLTTAGYTRYDRADFRAALAEHGIPLTTSSHVFDEPCAQHLAAMIFALARQLPQSLRDQWGARPWPYAERRFASRLLGGETAVLYGYGTIARRLCELLAPLRMELIGVRRAPRGDEGIRMVREAEADALLAGADHVINILPESAETRGYFDATRFGRMKAGARFYNIGRGPTVDQTALLGALRSGHLDAAYLDVTDPEPLPPEHPLWAEPNCFICPHTGGGHREEPLRLVRHFLANLRAFTSGGTLVDRVM
ncbi:MAG: D-2-hydroxyacid dehydrogenase [Verrucomicrobia bacterium]|nr:D-2-hydroxyacid dehydrogenase [Verrucomicrobiota bacterium]